MTTLWTEEEEEKKEKEKNVYVRNKIRIGPMFDRLNFG
jgi:hypothetical protein